MTGMPQADRDLRSIEQARRLAEKAAVAARAMGKLPQERIDAILDKMQQAALPHAAARCCTLLHAARSALQDQPCKISPGRICPGCIWGSGGG